MNKDQFAGEWKQFTGKIREKWGELTDDDLDVLGGQWDQLVGAVQKRYGLAKEDAERQVEEFQRALSGDDGGDRAAGN